MCVLVMIAVGVAVFGFGIPIVGFPLVRGSKFAAITEEDCDDAYDECRPERARRVRPRRGLARPPRLAAHERG
jgi:hypothetical protein